MLNYQTWLEKPETVRALLVQIERTAGTVTEYLSTHTVTVSGTQYSGIVKNSFDITENINTDYSANINYGSVDIVNGNGELDTWLTTSFIWVNKTIRVYVGELPAPGATVTLADNFELIFDGIISDIDAKDRFTLSFKVRDKLEKLNTSISETLLGNYYNNTENVPIGTYNNQNKAALRPVCFGEVFNITPLLTDPVYLEYMVHLAECEQIIEVRDNGIPVNFTTAGIPLGSFRLTKSPAGTITASVQGSKNTVSTTTGAVTASYDPSAKNTILNILRMFGKTLTAAEIDLTSFTGSYATEAVGIYLSERANVLQVCQDIAKSVGCVMSVTRLGKTKLINLEIPGSATTTITDSDVLLNSMTVARRIEVIAGVKSGISRNYTVQNNLVTAIPEDHKSAYAEEYLESSSTDATTKTNYGITVEPKVDPSYLINLTEADTVTLKKLNLFKAGRVVYKMVCTAKFLTLELGSAVSLTSSRFGLSSKLGLVIATKPDWIKGTIEIEVLV